MVIVQPHSPQASLLSRLFRRHGWEVHQRSGGPEARRLVAALHPDMVILAADLPAESGWLTAAKIMLERPAQRVILIGPASADNERLADFLGATYLMHGEVVPFFAEELQPATA
jgi:DNA-binding response OmpR family regulator